MTLAPAACAFAYAAYAGAATCGDPFSLQIWLYVAAALQLVNFAVILYVFCKFDVPYNPADPKNADFLSRMNTLLCYDPIVAVYLIIIAFQVAWQVNGCVGSRGERGDCGSTAL